jgi:hypothetical protein
MNRPTRPAERAKLRLLCAGLALLAVAASSAIRIGLAYRDPALVGASAEGLLKSDPALLYYFTERIVESGGGPPADLRHDPRVEHPLGTDLAAHFPIAQEYLVAWVQLALGERVPLHVVAIWVMSIFASLAAVGVFGLAYELTGRATAGALAAAFFVLSPSAYRTAGFVLMGEDASLPLFAVHAWLLARACRLQTPLAFALSGFALGGALATWHAMSFVVAVEAVCVLAWTARSGENPLALRGSWAFALVVAAFAVLVPVLRANAFWASIPMQVLMLLVGLHALAARRPLTRAARVAATLAGAALLGGTAAVIARAAGADSSAYAHVFELMSAKVRYLGELPADPNALSFGARLLWQGPFETAAVREILAGSLVAAVLLGPAALEGAALWRHGRRGGRAAVVIAFAVASALLAKLVRRNLALAGLALPVVGAAALARRGLDRSPAWAVGLVAVQLVCFASVMQGRDVVWYDPVERTEIAALVDWMRANVPGDGAVASDFVISTAVLAHTRHPIALQPKYEITVSRDRIEEFLRALFRGSRAELAQLLDRWSCRYLLVDRKGLWEMRYIAGLPLSLHEPVPGTAAATFLGSRWEEVSEVPGFRLLYHTPAQRYLLYERVAD